MCGICGQYNFKSLAPVEPARLQKMTRQLVHRGPDDEGFFVEGPLGFGFRRLSIIDIAGGHQPMSDREATVWVIFNGEIYNFPELRAELEGHGHLFRTRSDTEVIVHGYKQWGLEVLQHLNGMFGLAIWDARARRLVVARDAMGIKLVYYRLDEHGLTFGSELRAVRAGVEGAPDVDPVALSMFLRYRYTPSPHTLHRGIRKLAAGTMLICEAGEVREERWYRYKPRPFSPMPTPHEAEEELLARYRRAVKRHLLSDVPVGLLLSGGLDSGLLLALMNEHGSGWPTYTVGYGATFVDDELQLAGETARLLGSTHSSIELNQASFFDALPRMIDAVEEPIATSSIVPMYFVCELARRDVKVALLGQGPDELFGGYKRHLGVRYGAYWAALPAWLRTPLAGAVSRLPRNETLKRGVYALGSADRMERYEKTLALVPAETMRALFRDDALPASADTAFLDCSRDFEELIAETGELGGLQFLEIRSTLPDELLMFGDKLSMAHGLEARVPYLDREIVEWVECLDASFKVRRLSRKWLHRRICSRMLPTPILARKKRGFGVNVVDGWLRDSGNSGLTDLLRDPSSVMYELLQPTVVSRLLAEHVAGRHDNHKLLFSLVVLELWLRGNFSSNETRGDGHQEEPLASPGFPVHVG
jgi:asparagine synthase (glutamine-hydrolysing)